MISSRMTNLLARIKILSFGAQSNSHMWIIHEHRSHMKLKLSHIGHSTESQLAENHRVVAFAVKGPVGGIQPACMAP